MHEKLKRKELNLNFAMGSLVGMLISYRLRKGYSPNEISYSFKVLEERERPRYFAF
jgi:hypothetical protein